MKVLNVRLDDDEHAALKGAAAKSNLSVSGLVKDWISRLDHVEAAPNIPIVRSIAAAHGIPVEEVPALLHEAKPAFLSAPVDDCPSCAHERQESDHLGGRPCKYKIGRRNCGCTFYGF